MRPLLRALDVDLVLEYQGHPMNLQGSGGRFAARFPTLSSAIVFLRALWPYRKRLPSGITIDLQWKWIRIALKSRA
jgi:hypothetical protein